MKMTKQNLLCLIFLYKLLDYNDFLFRKSYTEITYRDVNRIGGLIRRRIYRSKM